MRGGLNVKSSHGNTDQIPAEIAWKPTIIWLTEKLRFMYRLLLPIKSERTFTTQRAEYISSLPFTDGEVQVVILHIQPEIDMIGSEGSRVSSDKWYDDEEVPQGIIQIKEHLEGEGIEVNVIRDHADPAECILETTTTADIDQIVLSVPHRTPVGKALFGSIVQSVILNSDVPVTVLTEDFEEKN